MSVPVDAATDRRPAPRKPVVVVTGATGGAGAMVTRHFLAQGAHVIGMGLRPVPGLPLGALWIEADLTSAVERRHALETLRRTAGRIDTLVGTLAPDPAPVPFASPLFSGLPPSEPGSTDLSPTILLCSEAVPLLRKSTRPLILTVCPARGDARLPLALYQTMKCGFGAFSTTLRNTLARTSIRVVTVSVPGNGTDLTSEVIAGIMRRADRGETDIQIKRVSR
ncbi:MAG: SDR family NAD(P)-dependent oxidoreductase [Alphaproteobacteria bacterium]